MRNHLLLALSALILAALACGGETDTQVAQPVDGAPADTAATPASFQAAEPTDLPEPTATPDPNLLSPGTYLVGTDIAPGLYRGETGTNFLDSCYWARLSNLSGDFDALLANDNSIGQFYLEVLDGDAALETACQLARLESLPEPPEEFPTSIGPGSYLVGIDIQPGLYRGETGTEIEDWCYWQRVTGFSGDFDELIANDNAVGQYFVEVQASDYGLTTACELELAQ